MNNEIRLQSKDNSLSQNKTTNDRILRCKMLQIMFFTCALFSFKNKAIKGNKFCQFFVSNKGYIDVLTMKSQDSSETTLYWFCEEVIMPVNLIQDRFSAQTK